ncbi:MAG: hypothetical protein ACYDBQ_08110 [Thermoplasmatota archaeon]
MTAGLADADLVTAIVKTSDYLKRRAEGHLAKDDVTVPFSVGIELLFVAQKHGLSYVDFIGAASTHFTIDRVDVLLTAAEALDNAEIATVFDAVHASQALVDETTLHTTDQKILASPFPTTRF